MKNDTKTPIPTSLLLTAEELERVTGGWGEWGDHWETAQSHQAASTADYSHNSSPPDTWQEYASSMSGS